MYREGPPVSTSFIRSRDRQSRRIKRGGAQGAGTGPAGTILIPLLLGVIQYGWYFYVAQTTGGAATHVTRRLSVGDCWGSGQALTFVKTYGGLKAEPAPLSR